MPANPIAAAAATPAIQGADTAWMLVSTVLVFLMTMPGLMLFYSGMLRKRNALSIMAQTIASIGVVTVLWAALGYTLAFDVGNGWWGGLSKAWASGLVGPLSQAHVLAPTVPESVFFLFQMGFAIVAFALVLGATAERMRIGVAMVFAAGWLLLVYAPVAHWVWHPTGWLASMGHMDFAGGTVVHIAAGASGLAAAVACGARRGFGKEPMAPHNLTLTVLGAGLLWAGWFGFNAGSAFEAGTRAAGALLVTQVAAGAGALAWGFAEMLRRQQMSVLGMATGAIAGLIAITPASGFVGVSGGLAIGVLGSLACFGAVSYFKALTGIDDSLDVFALHGVGGLVGTVLTPVFALPSIAPVTATPLVNLVGALAVLVYAAAASYVLLKCIQFVVGLRVTAKQESVGLDLAQHGESAT
ncbi:MAG: ammonium transporter [Hydrogenophaga sp.]|uniref:ammonium transporter n=1 Tax=Hydrogenophaga sp. TaxID=1904254 RepID=UPI001DF4C3FA|nr:ammonium transporter [Hydrogenophaga sp.]MBX3611257.1 ammonium transporter [Hydrogenophaga sp.]